MDLSKLVGQQLLKISQSSETGQHIIEFAEPSDLNQQIVEIDAGKLGKLFTLASKATLKSTNQLCWKVSPNG